MPIPLLAAILSFLSTLALTPVVRAAAHKWGFLDRPNERSSHTGVVPRAGGLAIVLALGLAVALAPQLWRQRPAAAALLAGIVVLALVGLCDDRFGLSPLLRFVVHIAVAVALVASAGPIERLPLPPPLDLALGPAAAAASVLWIVVAINFYNFMDGIDGIAGVQAVVTGAGLAWLGVDPFVSLVAAALAGAAAGFLAFNWSPASVFLGDAGSGALGFALAALPFLATTTPKPTAVGFVLLSLWPFLSDASWTLVRRLARGERVYQAHREHLYQRLVISGLGHASVTAALGAGALLVTLTAAVALRSGSVAGWWAALALAVALFALEAALVRARQRRPAAG